jgi:hypothetical protein
VHQLSRYPWRTASGDVTGSLWITRYSRRIACTKREVIVSRRTSALLACLISQLLIHEIANRVPVGSKMPAEVFSTARENFYVSSRG